MMMTKWLVYQGEREGTFSLNSRVSPGKKYKVSRQCPFEIDKGDLWIASIPSYRVLSLVNFVPTTVRTENPDTSYLTRWEGAFVEGLAASQPDPVRVVEIGTGKGISLARLLIGLSHHTDVMVWSIDLKGCEDAREHVQKCQIPNWRYELLIGDSATIGSEWNEPLDMAHLDGNHAYEGVFSDAKAWGEHVKVGGVLTFHDYGNRRHQVTAAANDAMKGKQWRKIGRVGYLIAFEKVSEDD
jgi:predicted O-methyltransferase YrrM